MVKLSFIEGLFLENFYIFLILYIITMGHHDDQLNEDMFIWGSRDALLGRKPRPDRDISYVNAYNMEIERQIDQLIGLPDFEEKFNSLKDLYIKLD